MSTAAIYTLHGTNPAKLAAVMDEMRELGAPTIHACYQGDHYCALEGTHRVEAARLLGLSVRIVEVEESDVIDDHDLYDLPDETTVEAILEYGDWVSGGHIQDIVIA